MKNNENKKKSFKRNSLVADKIKKKIWINKNQCEP